MPKSRSPARRRTSAKPRAPKVVPPPAEGSEHVPPARPTALRDATEDLGDIFDEALRHVLVSANDDGLEAGPVLPLNFERVSAGTLGWSSTVWHGPPPSPDGDRAVVGALLLLVLPTSGGEGGRPPRELPLTGASWAQFTSVDVFPGPPRLLLLSRASTDVFRDALRRLARALLAQLDEELRSDS